MEVKEVSRFATEVKEVKDDTYATCKKSAYRTIVFNFCGQGHIARPLVASYLKNFLNFFNFRNKRSLRNLNK